MGTSRISSDVMTAQSTISRLTEIEDSVIQNEHFEFAGNNIPCANNKIKNLEKKKLQEILLDFKNNFKKYSF